MELIKAIRERRTVHLYRHANIDKAVLVEGLEAALLAPNHRFTFPWRFYVLGDNARQQLHQLAVAKALGKRENADATDRQAIEEKMARKFLNPAAIVVFAQKRCHDPLQAKEDYAALSCAIQNFCLVMTNHGFGSKWSTTSLLHDDAFHRLVGLDPSDVEPVGLISVGLSAVELPGQKRPCIDELTTYLD